MQPWICDENFRPIGPVHLNGILKKPGYASSLAAVYVWYFCSFFLRKNVKFQIGTKFKIKAYSDLILINVSCRVNHLRAIDVLKKYC